MSKEILDSIDEMIDRHREELPKAYYQLLSYIVSPNNRLTFNKNEDEPE